jgi:hypothetical protein
MDRAYSASRRAGVLLFDEDFDLPPRSDEPEVIEPVFSAAELNAAREEAARNGRDAALAEIDASEHAAARRALTAIATELGAVRAEADAHAEQSADAIAGLLLRCFATAFPALSKRHGPGETAAVVRAILPAMRREPNIAVRVSPHLVTAMTEELQSLDADLASRVRVIPTDALDLGDVRVSWEHGGAIRDTNLLWIQIENILTQTGLMNAQQTAKERELVE